MGRHGTIAGRKAAQDSKRAAMFTKYAKAITVAAKDGGDPDYNAGLRVAIEKAKAISMPNDNIQRAIKKGTGELGGATYEELTFEGYGPGGVAFIVNCLTDNTNRTTSSVRSSFDKQGGNLGTPGCVAYMFSRKGYFLIEKTDAIDEDALMETALEAGADDMVTEEDSFTIYSDPSVYLLFPFLFFRYLRCFFLFHHLIFLSFLNNFQPLHITHYMTLCFFRLIPLNF